MSAGVSAVQLVRPGVHEPIAAPPGAWSVGPWQAAATVGLVAAVGVFAVVRTLRPVPEATRTRRVFTRLARSAGLKAEERATICAMGQASRTEPSALVLSERALRRARVAALAAGDGEAALSSSRVKAACARLGVE